MYCVAVVSHTKVRNVRTYVTHGNMISRVKTYVTYDKCVISEHMLHANMRCALSELMLHMQMGYVRTYVLVQNNVTCDNVICLNLCYQRKYDVFCPN